MRGRTPLYSFNGGEISSRMEGRSDLDGIWDRALAKVLNFVATVEGPALKRPGFRFIRSALASASWLSPFVFSTTQSYLIEWGNQVLRFYTNGGRIETNGVPLEVVVPYTAAQAPFVSTRQSFDRLYTAHPSHPPGMINRLGAESFAFQWMPLRNGPFKDWNTDKASTVGWSGASGIVGDTVDLTASKAIFKPGHVGGPFMIEAMDFSAVPAWESQVDLAGIPVGSLRRSDGKIYQLAALPGGGTKQYTGTIQPTHTEGAEWDGSGVRMLGAADANDVSGALWEYQYDRFGQVLITEYVSPTQVRALVTRRLPATVSTYKWALGCFSDAEGWPQLVTVWNQRLVFFKGTEIMGSVQGDYFNFAPITSGGIYAPDMAFRRALNMSDPPLWCHADKEYLLAGCARNEVLVGLINRAEGLSADNIKADPQSGYGSAAVFPVSAGTSLVFVQRGGRKLREAIYSGDQERFAAANINIFARHITRSGLKWLAFQQEPEEMLWGGRADGLLVAHPHNPDQQVKGFSRVQLAAGKAIAGAAIPSEDGSRDELWILADLDGQKSVLQLAPWWDEDADASQAERLEQRNAAFYVDFGVSYDGRELGADKLPLGPRQTFTQGLSHLEGRTVRILADGTPIDGLQVVGGSLTLPAPATQVHIGLGYQARLKLLRPEIRAMGTINGLRRRILRLFARVIDSAGLGLLDVRGESDALLESGTPGVAPVLYSGDTDNCSVGSGSGFTDTIELVSDNPLPAIVSMLIPTWDVEDFERE